MARPATRTGMFGAEAANDQTAGEQSQAGQHRRPERPAV